MTELQQSIVDKIRSSGPIPFASYMSQALYDPTLGYYSADRPRTGWHGHFMTSPELDPAFGELWANGLREIWEATGSPDLFQIVEIGPGEGAFAKAVLDAAKGSFGTSLRYHLVERSPFNQRRQQELLKASGAVRWSQSLADLDRIDQGVIFVNEVLDNLPVHLVEHHRGRLLEVWVNEIDGRLVPELHAPSTPEIEAFIERYSVTLPEGTRFEVGLAAEAFVNQICDLLKWGAAIWVDYGAETDDLVGRPDGTLVCYSGAASDGDPFAEPGAKDITTHANWSVVRSAVEAAGCTAVGPMEQRKVLAQLGLAELDRALREEHSKAMVSGKGAAAVRALSRRQALGALADPGGLGGLGVMLALKDISPPRFIRS